MRKRNNERVLLWWRVVADGRVVVIKKGTVSKTEKLRGWNLTSGPPPPSPSRPLPS